MIPIYNLITFDNHQRDVSEEKAGKWKRTTNELTQNNKDLKQFSYNISQLRAPLSTLTGLLNLIEDIPIDKSRTTRDFKRLQTNRPIY
jgi:light-regulated signal transduction histidine kinase (bacteriophytochrome)